VPLSLVFFKKVMKEMQQPEGTLQKRQPTITPIHGWAILHADGTLAAFALTKQALLWPGHDTVPERILSDREQELYNAGFIICKVKLEVLPLESDRGDYTALFEGQINIDFLRWGGLIYKKLESQVMGRKSRREAGWGAEKINTLGVLENLCGYLVRQPGGIEEYGWEDQEYQDLLRVCDYPHTDHERYKQHYENLKNRVKIAIAKRGIEFAKITVTPIPDESLES
jgi:hypothetical protein